MKDDIRPGYVLSPEGGKILPITHVNLIFDNGITLRDELDSFQDALDLIDSRIKVYDVKDLKELNSINPAKLKDGTICYVTTLGEYYTYTAKNKWKKMVTDTENHERMFTHVWIGTNPPQSKSFLWIDTSILNANPDRVSTYPPIIKQLSDTISSLNQTILELTERVTKLENNSGNTGGNTGGGSGEDSPGSGGNVDNNSYFLTEDGNIFITEDGIPIVLENNSSNTGNENNANSNYILAENRDILTTEDNKIIELESKK